MRVRSIAVLLAALVAAGAAPAAEKIKVEYKPSDQPTEYWIRTIDRSQHDSFPTTPPAGADDWHTYDTLELARQWVKPGGEGFLDVTIQPLGKTLRVNGRKIDTPGPLPTMQYRMSGRGELPDALASGDLAASLVPVFPAEPIAIGHKWTVDVPPSESFKHPYKVTHLLEKVETYQGVPTAYVMTEGQAVTKDKDLAFNLTVSGATRVALDSGQLVKSQTVTVFNVQAVGRFKDGSKIQRRQVQRIVERRVPGSDIAPKQE